MTEEDAEGRLLKRHGGGHDDAFDRLIKAQDAALKGAAGRAVKEEPCLLIRNGLSCWLNFQAALEAGSVTEQGKVVFSWATPCFCNVIN